jgi:hypothetical protein
MEMVKKKDKYYYDWIIKWTARYLCPEHHRGIAKFSQALRVSETADQRIPKKLRPKLEKYLRDNHPGYRKDYDGDDDEDE